MQYLIVLSALLSLATVSAEKNSNFWEYQANAARGLRNERTLLRMGDGGEFQSGERLFS